MSRFLSAEEGTFMNTWAQRLAEQIGEWLPGHILARAKVSCGRVGIELRARRDAALARFEHPLRLFLAWQQAEISAFLLEPLQNAQRLQDFLRSRLQASNWPCPLDWQGGSQAHAGALVIGVTELGATPGAVPPSGTLASLAAAPVPEKLLPAHISSRA